MSTSNKALVDWELAEKHYRAGILSLRQIAQECGITDGAIRKRAKKDLWTRNLAEKIRQRAADKVRRAAVRTPSTQLTPACEIEVIEQNSDMQASVILSQRQDFKRTRTLFTKLLCEVATATDEKDGLLKILDMIRYLVDRSLENAHDMGDIAMTSSLLGNISADINKLTSITVRIDSAKKLTEMLERLVRMERESFGIKGEEEGGKGGIEDLLAKISNLD
ncbi:MAG: hypothetical protein RLZZ591_1665 [Pseudomonadota bacterium]|jgi:hypothetical protein